MVRFRRPRLPYLAQKPALDFIIYKYFISIKKFYLSIIQMQELAASLHGCSGAPPAIPHLQWPEEERHRMVKQCFLN